MLREAFPKETARLSRKGDIDQLLAGERPRDELIIDLSFVNTFAAYQLEYRDYDFETALKKDGPHQCEHATLPSTTKASHLRMQIAQALSKLASQRPVFCSEADFQHSLAWRLREEIRPERIRLEYSLEPKANKRLDIWMQVGGQQVAFELKYKTRLFTYRDPERGAMDLQLRNQSAQDQARYDFLADIKRLEDFVALHSNAIGYALLLTNDRQYWRMPRHKDTCDAAFRIHNGRRIEAGPKLDWRAGTKRGTKSGRTASITLGHSYTIKWETYAWVPDRRGVEFKYLLVEVRS